MDSFGLYCIDIAVPLSSCGERWVRRGELGLVRKRLSRGGPGAAALVDWKRFWACPDRLQLKEKGCSHTVNRRTPCGSWRRLVTAASRLSSFPFPSRAASYPLCPRWSPKARPLPPPSCPPPNTPPARRRLLPYSTRSPTRMSSPRASPPLFSPPRTRRSRRVRRSSSPFPEDPFPRCSART